MVATTGPGGFVSDWVISELVSEEGAGAEDESGDGLESGERAGMDAGADATVSGGAVTGAGLVSDDEAAAAVVGAGLAAGEGDGGGRETGVARGKEGWAEGAAADDGWPV